MGLQNTLNTLRSNQLLLLNIVSTSFRSILQNLLSTLTTTIYGNSRENFNHLPTEKCLVKIKPCNSKAACCAEDYCQFLRDSSKKISFIHIIFAKIRPKIQEKDYNHPVKVGIL